MGITQKQIAQGMGLSFVTVNRALNNSKYTSEELKTRVRAYAEKAGYVPHRASQVLVKNRTRTIAIFSSVSPEYFWRYIKQGIAGAAEQISHFNYRVRYHRIPDGNTKKYLQVLKGEIKQGLDAAAFVGQGNIYVMDDIFAFTEKAGIPYVLYNIDIPESNRICYIGADYRSGGRLAANYIGKNLRIKGGGTALVLAGAGQTANTIFTKRLEGFLSLMNQDYPEITSKTICLGSVSSAADQEEFRAVLKKHTDRADALYLIVSRNHEFLEILEGMNYRNIISVLHDTDDRVIQYLDRDILTAAVYQDPILQGYAVTRTLEQILESGNRERQKDTGIIHTLIFKENTRFIKNHYLLPESRD
jgi:LacI family transcriptional regulator